MQVQEIQQTNQFNKQPSFKGPGDLFLRYLVTNKGLGCNLTDFSFMAAPRTTTDFIERGPGVGWETARRECAGTLNDTFTGAYGLTAGAIAALVMGIDKGLGDGVKCNNILTGPETFKILAENKAYQIKNQKTQADYIKNILQNLKAYNPGEKADAEGYVKLSDETINKVANILDKAIDDNTLKFKEWKKSKAIDSVVNLITEDTGTQTRYVLKSAEKSRDSVAELKQLVTDIFVTSKTFNIQKVHEAFEDQVKNNLTVDNNTFVKKFTKFFKAKSLGGVGIAAAVGLATQPINAYITKKKTGSDGFVGVEGREKDNSFGFKMLKVGVAALAFTAVLGHLVGFGMFKTPKQMPGECVNKLSFKGYWPTTDQLKAVFGLTIVSRILAARDKDELRESITKDSLGYISWLILGDVANRLVATASDKSVLNTPNKHKNSNFFKKAFFSEIKTRDEIVIQALHEGKINTIKDDGVAKSFKEMLKDVDKLAPELKKATKKKLRVLNAAQIAGYAFSGVLLGWGVPTLNRVITNSLVKKRKAQEEEQQRQVQNQTAMAV